MNGFRPTLAEAFFGRPAAEGGHGRIIINDVAGGIAFENTERDRLAQCPEAGFALAESFVGKLTIRYIPNSAQFPDRLALGIKEHLGDLMNVPHLPVGADDAMLEVNAA